VDPHDNMLNQMAGMVRSVGGVELLLHADAGWRLISVSFPVRQHHLTEWRPDSDTLAMTCAVAGDAENSNLRRRLLISMV
jgi:hypothetical protein